MGGGVELHLVGDQVVHPGAAGHAVDDELPQVHVVRDLDSGPFQAEAAGKDAASGAVP
jgi:hypothetical protein